ncbi:hypothetical protein NHX12_019334 [Muraenolepis orangiensis]|uniref:BRISC and BRCA1-A complex member 2 n=1 Tax=Muraenolepis orangiensis TaxID=630683 RepID=A0A9Q0IX42_9TELE|nr:hypothetical protein NHX12_019334 [Muraenolepis orangiensis]
MFNARYPDLPPDFIFGEDSEFIPEPSELLHLVQWDSGDPECLLQLVKELIQQYHQYQCKRLCESSRLLFEYDSLLEEPSYSHNMEVYAGRKNTWTGEFSARFLLKLPVDFSNIPVYLLKVTLTSSGTDPTSSSSGTDPTSSSSGTDIILSAEEAYTETLHQAQMIVSSRRGKSHMDSHLACPRITQPQWPTGGHGNVQQNR